MTMVIAQEPALYSTLASDPDLGELVDLFVSELPERVRTLQAALEKSDLEGLSRFAHQLKGAAGSYGFAELTPALKQLELLARQRGPEHELRSGLEEVASLCRRVRSGVPILTAGR